VLLNISRNKWRYSVEMFEDLGIQLSSLLHFEIKSNSFISAPEQFQVKILLLPHSLKIIHTSTLNERAKRQTFQEINKTSECHRMKE
jgi:hypothetical protein